jgi:hypothetical protein
MKLYTVLIPFASTLALPNRDLFCIRDRGASYEEFVY